ncbi:GDSL-type esterase/lipase family protein [uncultured Zhongshania sp.]|uniref:GDSL-type esterase/lipase family protein n=1 Tax=uncultured Zhongshania sp. TaxID=1642288 RepID=UPI0030DC7A61
MTYLLASHTVVCRLYAPLHGLSRACVALCTCLAIISCGGGNKQSNTSINTALPSDTSFDSLARCSTVDSIPAGQHMVTSWRTAPTDALITHPITALTVRQFFAPHWDGEVMRLQLSNRYSSLPVTLENIHIAKEVAPGAPELIPDSECLLTVGGENRITIPAGGSVVTDAIAYPIRAFERVGISFYAPAITLQITRHLGADEILYMSLPGDHSADPSGTLFQAVPDGYASNFLAIEALEVAAAKKVTTLVAVGDSITDGSGSTTEFLSGEPARMTSTDQRYPNHLQRRIHEAGLPISVANAGIGGNELLNDGWLPQFGVAMLDRLDYDVLAITGATHVLAMIGTNDFGNPKPGAAPSPEDMIAGYIELIEDIHRAGMKITLGTIPPAEGAVTDSMPLIGDLPIGIDVMHGTAEARASRDTVNLWIRTQELSDGIVDFDACLEDPENPGYLAAEYNSGDNLHPSPEGYAAMAECVNLDLFRTPDNAY